MSRAGAHTIYYIWRGGRTDFAKLRIKNFIHAIFSLFSCAESEKALFPTVFFQNNIPERYAGKHIFRKNKSFATYIQQYGKTFLVYFLDVRRYGCKAPGRWASRARDAFLPARFTDFFTMRRAGLRIFGLGAVARVGGPPRGARGRGCKVRRESQEIGIRINGILPAVIAWV